MVAAQDSRKYRVSESPIYVVRKVTFRIRAIILAWGSDIITY